MKATDMIRKLADMIAANGDDAMVFVATDDGLKLRLQDTVVELETVKNGGKVITIR